jgi:hypothetical protein
MLPFVCNCLCNTVQMFNFGAESVIDLIFVVCYYGFCVCLDVTDGAGGV